MRYIIKTDHYLRTPEGKDIPYYYADGKLYFSTNDLLPSGISAGRISKEWKETFDASDDVFIGLEPLRSILESSESYTWANRSFWRHTDNWFYTRAKDGYQQAQLFCQSAFGVDLPDDWAKLNFKPLIDRLKENSAQWIKTARKSLSKLATTAEQKSQAAQFYDKCAEELNARQKENIVDKDFLAELLTATGMTKAQLCDLLINPLKEEQKAAAQSYNERISKIRQLLA